MEGLSEQQAVAIRGLQGSMEAAEEALSQGLEVLNQSLSDTIAYDSLVSPPQDMANYMVRWPSLQASYPLWKVSSDRLII
ncbi:unnamed protein product [Rhodiola kirilowii]